MCPILENELLTVIIVHSIKVDLDIAMGVHNFILFSLEFALSSHIDKEYVRNV